MATRNHQGVLEIFKIRNGPPSYELTLSLYDKDRFLDFYLIRGDDQELRRPFECQIESATRLPKDEWIIAGLITVGSLGGSTSDVRMFATYNTGTRTGTLYADLGDGVRKRPVGAIVVYLKLHGESFIRFDDGRKQK